MPVLDWLGKEKVINYHLDASVTLDPVDAPRRYCNLNVIAANQTQKSFGGD